MKIKIAIFNITGGGMSGGYRKYLQNVIPRMAVHPDVEAILCASPRSINVQDWFEPLSNVKFVDCRPFRFLGSKLDPGLKKHLESFSPDVIFIPLERFFRFDNVPVVNMVQNMEPIVGVSGNPFIERFQNWVRRTEGKRSLSRTDRVIVPSEYVRDFLFKRWKVPGEKIGLVYHGIESFQKDISQPQVIPKGWDGRFLFTAGSIRPARGLEDLLQALKYLSENSSNISNLVIAGEAIPRMRKYKKQLEDWIQKNNLFSEICWAGHLSKQEMGWCYKNCQAFIITSRVESFGLIAVEAMAHGCICVSSDSSCLPEIFDKAAVFYPTQRPKILAQKINEVLNWPKEKKEEMRRQAIIRASQFSWDKCAEQTVVELKKSINDSTFY